MSLLYLLEECSIFMISKTIENLLRKLPYLVQGAQFHHQYREPEQVRFHFHIENFLHRQKSLLDLVELGCKGGLSNIIATLHALSIYLSQISIEDITSNIITFFLLWSAKL